jgi:hypothetical protein
MIFKRRNQRQVSCLKVQDVQTGTDEFNEELLADNGSVLD